MSYAQRIKLSKLELAKRNSKWAAQKPDAATEKAITQQHRDLWDALNQFVTERAGAIVSPRHIWPIRLEVDPESKLPDRLRELGHDPIFLQQETRIGAPISTQRGRFHNANAAYSFRSVNVFTVKLPVSK